MPDELRLRAMTAADRDAVAELIAVSTNHYYETHFGHKIFAGGDEATGVFFDTYEALDPGCGLLVESPRTGRLMGSCFYHPRATHVSLGIMNVHPNHCGRGVARMLLSRILEIADGQRKPVRLVSSALNLDSFSLYTRAGFVPRQAYQDMMLAVPAGGLHHPFESPHRIRDAMPSDVHALSDLEFELAGIRRDGDYRHFITNHHGFWHLSVHEDGAGRIDGFMASSGHPGCNMVGPGLARSPEIAAALLLSEYNRHRGRSPVCLIPVDAAPLVRFMYKLGAKNVELHFSQVRGEHKGGGGLSMPTFLPESA
jgi:GNAT superfamily N-acetyltransferase